MCRDRPRVVITLADATKKATSKKRPLPFVKFLLLEPLLDNKARRWRFYGMRDLEAVDLVS